MSSEKLFQPVPNVIREMIPNSIWHYQKINFICLKIWKLSSPDQYHVHVTFWNFYDIIQILCYFLLLADWKTKFYDFYYFMSSGRSDLKTFETLSAENYYSRKFKFKTQSNFSCQRKSWKPEGTTVLGIIEMPCWKFLERLIAFIGLFA